MNTARAVVQSNTVGRAVTVADSYTTTVSGVVFSDWFLPSKYELDEMYFHKTMIGGFSVDYYWSSSEATANDAWYHYFVNGGQYTNPKAGVFRVRPVRAF